MFNFTEDDIKRAYREGFYRALNGDAGFTEDEFIKILKTMNLCQINLLKIILN